MDSNYYVYILTNKNNTVLYIGVTNDLIRRIYEHKSKLIEGFSSKYNVDKLVYFEQTNDIESAILREKQLKKWSRIKKDSLIESSNPLKQDLSLIW
jgi:putative endonuclease